MPFLTKYWTEKCCTTSCFIKHYGLIVNCLDLPNRKKKSTHYTFNFGDRVFGNVLVSDLSADQLWSLAKNTHFEGQTLENVTLFTDVRSFQFSPVKTAFHPCPKPCMGLYFVPTLVFDKNAFLLLNIHFFYKISPCLPQAVRRTHLSFFTIKKSYIYDTINKYLLDLHLSNIFPATKRKTI